MPGLFVCRVIVFVLICFHLFVLICLWVAWALLVPPGEVFVFVPQADPVRLLEVPRPCVDVLQVPAPVVVDAWARSLATLQAAEAYMPGGDVGAQGPHKAAVEYAIPGCAVAPILLQDFAVAHAFRRTFQDGAWMSCEAGPVHVEVVLFGVLSDLRQGCLFPMDHAARLLLDKVLDRLAECRASFLAPSALLLDPRSVTRFFFLESPQFLAIVKVPRLLLDEGVEAQAPKAAFEAHGLRISGNGCGDLETQVDNEHQVFENNWSQNGCGMNI